MSRTRFLWIGAAVAVSLVVSCGQAVDNSLANPEWRNGISRSVSFPLSEPVTLSVGLAGTMTAPPPGDPTLAWLEEQTGISLEFVSIPQSPGDIEFGELIRAGELPDILAEARVDLTEPTMHRLFVNVLEFPSLVPNFSALLSEDEVVRDATLSRLTSDGQLLSLGTFDSDAMPFFGVLAYREDLFREHGLSGNTWADLRSAMERLKELYPQSYPLGGRFATILQLMPSWFGSGYDPRNVVYYDVGEAVWKFGPFEPEFRRFVTFLAEAYQDGLLDPTAIAGQAEQQLRNFVNDVVFMAAHRGPTGPLFRFPATDYGSLNEDGEWDGTGRWVSALPLPPSPSGDERYVSHERWTPVSPGWLVYTQGERVGETLAFLDFLYTEESSTVLALGPPGDGWSWSDGTVVLSEEALAAYQAEGMTGLQRHLGFAGVPLSGRDFDAYGTLGYPETPTFQYYLENDLAANRDVMVEPGVRVPMDDEEFSSRRIDAVITLQSHVESQVANFVIGRRPLSEWDAFVEQARDMGAERLVDLYNEQAVIPDRSILAPLLD